MIIRCGQSANLFIGDEILRASMQKSNVETSPFGFVPRFDVNELLTLETLHQVVGDLAGLRSAEQPVNVNELLTLQTLHQVVGDLAGLRSAEQRLRVFVVVFKCFVAITYNLVVLFLQVISFISSLVTSSVEGNLWLNTKGV